MAWVWAWAAKLARATASISWRAVISRVRAASSRARAAGPNSTTLAWSSRRPKA